MLIRIPLSELRKESPNFSVFGMENVSTVGMDVDRVFVEVIEAVPADVIFPINNSDLVTLAGQEMPQSYVCNSSAY